MALTELVSNLSVGLYGAPTPSQFVMPIGPGSSNTPSDAVTFATTNNGSLFYIQNSGNGISRRIVQGFNNLGYLAFFGNKQSKDNYPLFTALGENGTSRRMNQGGYGFPFKSVATGESFDWKPNDHTGWSDTNKYNDTINKSETFGLADTYTTNSPNLFSTFRFPLGGIFGIATLQNQGGNGFPFPIGPTGNVYDWKPEAHTGWNINKKYNDNIGAIYGTSGLADTYTTNSPIDDIYNKVKVRSAAWNKNSFGLATDQPFILRGIQRDNNSEPQFWGGFADTLTDIPRGGITTAVEREAVDKARLGKFMISPKGLIFQAKQFGLQLMNPNVEGVTGFWTGVTPRSNKIYNPLSVFSLNAPVPLHVRRDSFDPSGLTSYSYESVINERNVLGFGTSFNRLKTLYDEAFDGFGLGPLFNTPTGLPYLTISNLTGPKSVLGIGITNNNRYTNTSLRQSKLLSKETKGLQFITTPYPLILFANLINDGSTYDVTRYKDNNTYTSPDATTSLPGPNLAREYNSPLTKEEEEEWANKGIIKLREIYDEIKEDPTKSKVLDKNRSNSTAQAGKEYSTLAYGNLRKTNDSTNYNDFRFGVRANNFTSFIGNPAIADYAENNLFKKYGIPEYGAAGLDRSDPTKAAVTSGDQLGGTSGTDKDLIDFSLTIKGTIYRFRAYINSISNNWSVNSEDGTRFSLAQIVKSKKYVGIDHTIAIDFTIPVLSKSEHQLVMAKLDTLAKLSYGQPGRNDLNSRRYEYIEPLRIGKYIKTRAVINSLSYDVDNETPWDIDNETPMYVQVSINFTEIADVNNPISSTNNARVIYHP